MKWFNWKDNELTIGNWYTGWHTWSPEIIYRTSGYQYANAELCISLFGWKSIIRLPWIHKRENLWENKRYGFYLFQKTIFFNIGRKMKSWDLPFITYGNAFRWERYIGHPDFYFISSQYKESWQQHPYKTNYKESYQEPTTWTYDFTDPYDAQVIPCKFWVEEMEWRPKWLKWTKRFAKIKRFIEVEFSQEVGSKKGTWKGGTVGCSYDMLDDERPMDCMRRMEKEYNFN